MIVTAQKLAEYQERLDAAKTVSWEHAGKMSPFEFAVYVAIMARIDELQESLKTKKEKP